MADTPDTTTMISSPEVAEIKTALAVIATTGNYTKEELEKIRDRLHVLSNTLTPLMGIPEQIREMKEQHREMRGRMEDVQTKMGMIPTLVDRIGKLEPIVDSLVRDGNQARGVIWGSRFLAGLIGAGLTALIWLGLIRHP